MTSGYTRHDDGFIFLFLGFWNEIQNKYVSNTRFNPVCNLSEINHFN